MKKFALSLVLSFSFLLLVNQTQAQSKIKSGFKLDKITYNILDKNVREDVISSESKSLLKIGQTNSDESFKLERERIAKIIEKKEHINNALPEIKFLIDSTINKGYYSLIIVFDKK